MDNIYLPELVKITKVEQQSPTVVLLRFEKAEGKFVKNDRGMIFNPGQFVLVGKIGYGEAPFGPLSSPYEDGYMEIAVRKAGVVTGFLHNLKKGDKMDFRGPYGNGFPLPFMEGKDLVFVTGGCGIPPIASLVEAILKEKEKFGKVYLIYGAKTPDELLLKSQMGIWKQGGINVIATIDKPAPEWGGPVGFVSDFVKEIEVDTENAVAAMCGPGPMMDALEKILRPLGISDRRIFVNMERKMQCGVGRCQHCYTGKKCVCTDGPVFYYDEIENNTD